MAGWATKLEGTTQEISAPAFRKNEFFGYTRREPVGVVGAIVPWNFPLLMAAWKNRPGARHRLHRGIENRPRIHRWTALRFAELILEAGIPKGVVNVVTGLGHSAGAALASHPGVNKIAFTGSTQVGKLIGKAAMDNMTRVSLELGGKSPVIMFDDVDIKAASIGAGQCDLF